MVSNAEAQAFLLRFRGKSDTYVRNELPKERPEPGKKIKTKITNNEGKVDSSLLTHHLDGDFAIGVCPVNAEGKCFFGVIDIDYYKPEIHKVLDYIYSYELPLLPFRSKSGGLHVYLMLSKAVTARTMRALLAEIADVLCLEETYGKGKVEIFPKQDKAEGFGSSVTLPYFNCEHPYTYLEDADGNAYSFKDALAIMQKTFTSVEATKEALSKLPYNDAPPCLQHILLAHTVGSENSGRNNFLYSFGVYAKKKYGEGFEDRVREINDTFECPLPDNEVNDTIESVRTHETSYKCKDIPCSAYCSKATCKKREYGLGRDKGHFTNIEYGQLYRYMAAEPYYVWQLRLEGSDKWVNVTFANESELADQKKFAYACIRYLNQAPLQVSPNDWMSILNTVLISVKEVGIDQMRDTTELALIKRSLEDFLVNKQVKSDRMTQIIIGLSCRREEDGKALYYFTVEGFIKYLRYQRINYNASMLSSNLASFGVKEAKVMCEASNGFRKEINCLCYEESAFMNDKMNVTELMNEEMKKEFDKSEEKEKSYSEEDMKNAETML